MQIKLLSSRDVENHPKKIGQAGSMAEGNEDADIHADWQT